MLPFSSYEIEIVISSLDNIVCKIFANRSGVYTYFGKNYLLNFLLPERMAELVHPLDDIERNLFHGIERIIRVTLHAIGLIEANLRNV